MNTTSNPSSTRASPTLQDPSAEKDGPIFQKDDFLFLRDVYRIVDLIQSGKEQEEIGKAVAQLDERFDQARHILQELPGLQYNKEEQETILEREMALLDNKKQQLKSYMALPPFSDTPAMDTAMDTQEDNSSMGQVKVEDEHVQL